MMSPVFSHSGQIAHILLGRAIYDVLQGEPCGGFPLCNTHYGVQESGRATTVGEEGKGGNVWGVGFSQAVGGL